MEEAREDWHDARDFLIEHVQKRMPLTGNVDYDRQRALERISKVREIMDCSHTELAKAFGWKPA